VTGPVFFPFARGPLGRISKGYIGPKTLAPRVSPAAVRVPDPRLSPVEITFPSADPQLYVHEGARQALERRLAKEHHRPVALSVTDNRRQMISLAQRGGVLFARVHHMFLDAPVPVQEALARYLGQGDRAASGVVTRFIDDNAFRIRACRAVASPLVTQGDHHDIMGIFQMVNEKYFGGSVDALVTWGKRTRPNGTRRTIKLGSYSAVERLIRVHPVLDKPWVPRYFVSYILYHEMLHHVIPASQGTGRRMLHPPLFVARERLFRDYDRSLTWERGHVARLLRAG
jgi:hypothetical protein